MRPSSTQWKPGSSKNNSPAPIASWALYLATNCSTADLTSGARAIACEPVDDDGANGFVHATSRTKSPAATGAINTRRIGISQLPFGDVAISPRPHAKTTRGQN